jgi:cell division protein FtsW (lipid II flippase)
MDHELHIGRTWADLGVAALGVLLAGAIWALVPDQVPGYTLAAYTDMSSPAFFPITAAGLLLLISLAIAARAWLAARRGPEEPLEAIRPGRVLPAAGAMAAFVVLMPLLGTVVAMALLVAGLMLAFGGRRTALIAVTSIVTPVVIVTLFERVMLILFPHGVLY